MHKPTLLFQVTHQPLEVGETADIEDFGMPARPLQPAILISTKRKRASQGDDSQVESQDVELTQSWREILGPPPPTGTTRVGKQRGRAFCFLRFVFSLDPTADSWCRRSVSCGCAITRRSGSCSSGKGGRSRRGGSCWMGKSSLLAGG